MKRITFVVGTAVLIAACAVNTEANESPSTLFADSSETSAGAPSDPLDQMAIAFVGGYSRSEIKSRLDNAMGLYGLGLTSDNYSRAGSVLVALQNEFGPAEMDILDYMIRSYVPGVEISFPDAAALAVSFLSSGDQ